MKSPVRQLWPYRTVIDVLIGGMGLFVLAVLCDPDSEEGEADDEGGDRGDQQNRADVCQRAREEFSAPGSRAAHENCGGQVTDTRQEEKSGAAMTAGTGQTFNDSDREIREKRLQGFHAAHYPDKTESAVPGLQEFSHDSLSVSPCGFCKSRFLIKAVRALIIKIISLVSESGVSFNGSISL